MSRTLAFTAVVVMCIAAAIFLLLDLTGTPTLKPAVPLSSEPAPVRKFEVVAEYPHDPQALTQGLIYTGGFLYESTGLQGQSSLRKVDLATGRVLQERAISTCCVGEGLTEWHGQLIQLTPKQLDRNAMPASFDDVLRNILGPRLVNNDNAVCYD